MVPIPIWHYDPERKQGNQAGMARAQENRQKQTLWGVWATGSHAPDVYKSIVALGLRYCHPSIRELLVPKPQIIRAHHTPL